MEGVRVGSLPPEGPGALPAPEGCLFHGTPLPLSPKRLGLVKRRKPRRALMIACCVPIYPAKKKRKLHGTPFHDAERAGSASTFYDTDRVDEAKNEVKAHKVSSYHIVFPVAHRLVTQSVPALS